MRTMIWCALTVLVFAADVAAADFGTRGGPEPANVDEIANVLRQDPYDMELLISYGTSKGGSAGHLALAIRDQAPGDDLVYSANFYADRAPEHAKGFYTDDLMVRIPKKEYLFKTHSSLGDTASFGLDFGEIYKRSVIGVRVYGVPAGGEGGPRGVLQAHQRRLSQPGHEHRVPRPRDTVRLPAAQLRQDHRRRIQVRRRVPRPRGHERDVFLRAQGGGSCQRQHSHRDGDEAPQGVERARIRVGRDHVQEVRRLDLRGPARRGQGGVQGSAEPVSFGPVARLPQGAGSIRGLRQPLRDVPPLQPGPSTACA